VWIMCLVLLLFLFFIFVFFFFFFQAEDGIRDPLVTGVQTCALPISRPTSRSSAGSSIGSPGSSPRRGATSARWIDGDGGAWPTRSEERRVGKGGRFRGSGER